MSRKQSVSLKALEEAVEDGRIEIWMNFDGYIVVENVRSGKRIILYPSRNLEGERMEDES